MRARFVITIAFGLGLILAGAIETGIPSKASSSTFKIPNFTRGMNGI